jgi:hypothetical protein
MKTEIRMFLALVLTAGVLLAYADAGHSTAVSMQFGPDRVIECPHCAAIHRVFSLISGNTVTCTGWTDGYRYLPMLPKPPGITICWGCKQFFWVSEARQLGIVPRLAKNPDEEGSEPIDMGPQELEWAEAPEVNELEESEYYDAIDANMGDTRRRLVGLRILAWWRSNDKFRVSGDGDYLRDVQENRTPECMDNMLELYELLSDSDQDDWIMKAELARQFGRFDHALDLLYRVTDDRYSMAKERLIELCVAQVSNLQKLPCR